VCLRGSVSVCPCVCVYVCLCLRVGMYVWVCMRRRRHIGLEGRVQTYSTTRAYQSVRTSFYTAASIFSTSKCVYRSANSDALQMAKRGPRQGFSCPCQREVFGTPIFFPWTQAIYLCKGSLAVKLSVSKGKNWKSQKFFWTWTREALPWTFATREGRNTLESTTRKNILIFFVTQICRSASAC